MKDKYNLSFNEDLHFDEESHIYTYKGEKLKSVSEIVREKLGKSYEKVPAYLIDRAAEKGKAVHKLIENYFNGDVEWLEADISGHQLDYQMVFSFAKNFITFWDLNLCDFEIIGSELILTNGEFAGTLDIVAESEDTIMVLDIKTTSQADKTKWQYQLGCYEILLKYAIEQYCPKLTNKKIIRKIIQTNKSGVKIYDL